MLCERLTNLFRLADRTYIAEPKLDGQRAQLHVHHRRAVARYTRRGLDLLEYAGMVWLRTERQRAGGDMALVLFDVRDLGGNRIMREPWRSRRKRPEGRVERD